MAPHGVFGISDPVDSVEDQLARILGVAQEIQQTPVVMERVYQNMRLGYNVCNEFGGRHIESLLWWISTNHNSKCAIEKTVSLVCEDTILVKVTK